MAQAPIASRDWQQHVLGRSAVPSIKHLLLAGLITMSPALADDAPTNSLLTCATRDARFILQLEHHGDQGTMPGEKLYAAYRTMLRARTACSAGRLEDGHKLYDSAFGPVLASE
jgi:hypothetical protein